MFMVLVPFLRTSDRFTDSSHFSQFYKWGCFLPRVTVYCCVLGLKGNFRLAPNLETTFEIKNFAHFDVVVNANSSCRKIHLGPAKTRTHCHGGNIVPCDVARPWQNAATLLRAARTQEMFVKIFRNILCVNHKCCARGKTSQHLRNMIVSAMLPQQCVLVLSGPLSVFVVVVVVLARFDSTSTVSVN